MSTLLQDVLHAFRGLRKRPGFAVAALLTLALGIGANVTVFSLVNALLLRPLPFGDRSDRVLTLHSTHRLQAEDWGDSRLSYRDLVDVATQSTTFDGVGGFVSRNFTVSTDADAERLQGGSVTPNLFPLLGVQPMLGRNFTDDEGAAPGLESSVILTHGLWQRRFGSDPSIIGRGVIINERARVVVGVMAPGFKFPERSELYMPLRWDEAPRSSRGVLAVAVMKPGVTIERAQAEVDAIALRLQQTYPETNRGFGIRALMFRDSQVGADEKVLSATLMGAVGFVLLIACANLANLLLVRGAARQREMAVRAAMGASRRRLAWSVISESAVIAGLGTLLGTLAAVWALDFLKTSLPEELPFWMRVDLDVRIAAFAIVVTAFTTLAIGLLPALRASRPNVIADLKEGNRGMSLGRAAHRAQGLLVAGQVAMCLALLVGANLMIRSFISLQRADLGFDDGPVLTMRVYLAGDAYDDVPSRAAFFDRAVASLRELPGVSSAVVTTSIPGDDGGSPVRVVVDGRTAPGEEMGAQAIATTRDLFRTLNLELREGRTFTEAEAGDPQSNVTLINARLARQLWPSESAIGRRIGIVGARGVNWLRVIGVAPDIQYEEFGEETSQSQFNLFVPYAWSASRTVAVMLRTSGDPVLLTEPARGALRRLHGGLPVYDVRTMAEVRRFTTWDQRFFGVMMGIFAGSALLLACLGVYALLAYAARRRTHEIGVRLALGAEPGTVVGMFVWQASRIGIAGLVVGLVLAFGLARALSGTLFAVNTSDPWLFASMAGALLAVVLLASYLPARRAARVDPMIALRVE